MLSYQHNEEAKMKIEIQARKVSLPRKLHDYVERRVSVALTHFDESIMKVSLWLSDVNGPKGGRDKNCQVQIIMAGKPDVVIDETRENLYLAINLAIERARKTVIRKLDRQHSHAKRSAKMLSVLPGTT